MNAKIAGAEVRLVTITADELAAVVRAAVADALSERDPAPTPEILSTEQACAYLGVSRATLHRLVQSGQVRQRRLGDSPRYLRAELIEDLRREGER